ncbi:MAG: extracellular solute-binding protein, partial [Chloroflexi bacterium]|nr:extracellular solute-binding protein [Chloroflexota bacterium]
DRQVNDATLIQYLAAGGQLTNAEGRPWLDEGVMVSVLDFYSTCISSGPISPTYHTPAISPTVVLNITDADQAWEQFQAGEGGMTVVRASRYWREADETVAAASIPTRDGHPFSVARGWVVAMVADDPARQALAALLLDWLIAPERNAQWTQSASYLPGTRGALRLWDVSGADRAVLRGTMEGAVAAPPPEVMATTGRAIQAALEALLRRRVSPEDAAAAAGEILGQ